MADLTDAEIAELRELARGGEETALEWRAAVLAAHPFLLAEVERWRRGMLTADEITEVRAELAESEGDPWYIAWGRSLLPPLLDEVERTRALRPRIEEAVRIWRGGVQPGRNTLELLEELAAAIGAK